MARWLLKTEPGTYSFDDLAREKTTAWNGITNPTALIHIRAMKKNDAVLVYHTGGERAVVGTASVRSAPYRDTQSKNDKAVAVDLKVGKRLKHAVSLDTIKSDSAFEGWDLLRIGRLSVVPVPDEMWNRIIALSEREE